MNKETFESNSLKIEVMENNDAISAEWTGKSIHRNPGKFITLNGRGYNYPREDPAAAEQAAQQQAPSNAAPRPVPPAAPAD